MILRATLTACTLRVLFSGVGQEICQADVRMFGEIPRMTDVSPELRLTWEGVAWRAGIVVGLPLAVTVADYLGWLRIDTSSSLYPLMLIAILLVLMLEAARRKSPALTYYFLPLVLIAPPYFQREADRVQEVARWRIVLMESCSDAAPQSERAALCNVSRVRADFEPCDFGTTASQCRIELYRDAGWPLPQTPIPPHQYGETLPLGRSQ